MSDQGMIKISDHFAGLPQYCRISKNLKKWVYCFPLILRVKSSLQMYYNPIVCFEVWVTKFRFCRNSMISQLLPNFQTQFSQKEEIASYDNIALNQ